MCLTISISCPRVRLSRHCVWFRSPHAASCAAAVRAFVALCTAAASNFPALNALWRGAVRFVVLAQQQQQQRKQQGMEQEQQQQQQDNYCVDVQPLVAAALRAQVAVSSVGHAVATSVRSVQICLCLCFCLRIEGLLINL